MTLLGAGTAASAAPATPDLARAGAYLVAPANLIGGHYYEAFPGFSDFGLTIDGALALAGAGTDDPALKRIVDFFDDGGLDASGQNINAWTGIGTEFVSGGALGKEALLAEVSGYDPRGFGGHDLVQALADTVCPAPSPAPDPTCAAAGNFANATSVVAQSLAVIAQLRAGADTAAAAPIAYLESLQASSGAWPSLIPDSGNADVDSTAVAVMALALVDTPAARTAVAGGISWIASQQDAVGGFPGVAADSVNSTALAIQALELGGATHIAAIDLARAFLAGQQNPDGGFTVDPATPGSDVRASTQAVSGAVGTSFAVLTRDVSAAPAPPTTSAPTSDPVTTSPPGSSPSTTTAPTVSTTTAPASVSTSPGVAASTTITASTSVISSRAVDAASITDSDGQLAATGTQSSRLTVLALVLIIGGGAILVAVPRSRATGGGRHR